MEYGLNDGVVEYWNDTISVFPVLPDSMIPSFRFSVISSRYFLAPS
jgi:hypothetical protein